MKPHLLALATLFAFAGPLPASEYFVSPHGDDSAAGTSAQAPLKTITKGVSLLKAGDTLTLLPGEYVESVTTDVSGTAEAPVTIRAQRPGTATLRGDVEVSGFEPVTGLRHVYGVDFKRRVESVAERASLRTLDPRLTLAEVEMDLGTYFHDEKAGRLYVHCTDSRPPDQHRLTVSVTNACGLAFMGRNGIQHVVVDGLAFTGFYNRDYGVQHGSRNRWGLFFRDAKHSTVRRCVAYLNSGGIGLLGEGEGIVVEDCLAFANESRHHSIGCNLNGWGLGGATFRRNRVEGHSPGPTSEHDITFYSGRDGCAMEDNLALNAGLMIKGDLKDAIQRGNVVVGHKFYRFPDETNLELLHLHAPELAQTYADPLNGDFRLQSGATAKSAPRPAVGDVFYVSPEGDDAAPGSAIGKPWRTLAHAAKLARPGDTIYLLPGVYAESLVPAQSGKAEKPIRFVRHGHGLVVLDGGGGAVEIGANLSGHEHIELRGLVLRGHARFGILAQGSKHLHIEQCVIENSGGDGAAFAFVNGLRFAHNLVRDGGGTVLRLRQTIGAEVVGNVFAGGKDAGLATDAASLSSLWSDRNAFEPGAGVAELDGQPLTSLADWQSRTRLDAHSLTAASGIVPDEETGGLMLAADSPLLGAGPHALPIGPFLRLTERTEPEVADIRVRGVTDTTASLEWWLPGAPGEAFLEWGDTPACANRIELQPAAYHSASLVGLKPGAAYHFRIQPARYHETLRFATAARAERKRTPRPPATGVETFTTASAAPTPRTLHVSTHGDDTRDGLTADNAWRSIARAAAEARAGDTVLVHGGEYEEFVVVRGTGDTGAPLTFRAAPGEVVWMTGSGRARHTAFLVTGKSHVVIDGFRFRDFNALDGSQVVRFEGGEGHVVRRCFFDGRVASGYVNSFLGVGGVDGILVENNVVIAGMGDALSFSRCPRVTVQHNVIYAPSIRAITCQGWDLKAKFHLTHNIVFDTLPSKVNNPLVRLMDLENLESGHNLWFTRTGPEQRALFEPMRIGDKDVWQAKPGSRIGQKLLHAEVVKLTGGQDATSRFANPGLPVLAELYRPGKEGLVHREWMKAEMHLLDGGSFAPLDFKDFLPITPLLATDGQPIGLDPAAFR